MHAIVFYLATVWLIVLLGILMITVIRADTMITRILALDTVGVILAALLVLFAGRRGVPFYLDAALILAVFGFIQTLVVARYYGERGLFT